MENKFMRVEEVAAELDVSVSYAYKIIKQLNNELKAKGFVVRFCPLHFIQMPNKDNRTLVFLGDAPQL